VDAAVSDYNRDANVITDALNCDVVAFTQGPAGEPFEYELIHYWEAVSWGNFLVPGVTRSHSDTLGLSWIKDYAGSVANSEIGQKVLNGFSNYLARSAVNTMSYAAPLLYQAGSNRALEWHSGL